MKTKIEKKVHAVVAKMAQAGGSRNDVCRAASIRLNEKHGINVASGDSKAGDYLVDALNEYRGHENE